MTIEPERCPKCDADFDGGPIPEKIRHHYSPPYRWSRRIDCVSTETDRVERHMCPDCGYNWPVDRANKGQLEKMG